MSSGRNARREAGKPFFRLIDEHALRATEFRRKNRRILEQFSHMLGYPASTRPFMRAIIAGMEAASNASERSQEIEQARIGMKVSTSLEARFYNSLYAAVRLLSFGLQREALVLVRTAFEALQYFRLISLDQEAQIGFETNPLRPIDVRKRLAALGHDWEPIQKTYSDLSELSHIGGKTELDFDLENPDFGAAAIGGYVHQGEGSALLQDIVVMAHLFQGFALGISEDNVLQYFEEIRRALSDPELEAEQKATALFDAIERYRFRPSEEAG